MRPILNLRAWFQSFDITSSKRIQTQNTKHFLGIDANQQYVALKIMHSEYSLMFSEKDLAGVDITTPEDYFHIQDT